MTHFAGEIGPDDTGAITGTLTDGWQVLHLVAETFVRADGKKAMKLMTTRVTWPKQYALPGEDVHDDAAS